MKDHGYYRGNSLPEKKAEPALLPEGIGVAGLFDLRDLVYLR
jgi:hypothetical protein